jgi:hypothetical protein
MPVPLLLLLGASVRLLIALLYYRGPETLPFLMSVTILLELRADHHQTSPTEHQSTQRKARMNSKLRAGSGLQRQSACALP